MFKKKTGAALICAVLCLFTAAPEALAETEPPAVNVSEGEAFEGDDVLVVGSDNSEALSGGESDTENESSSGSGSQGNTTNTSSGSRTAAVDPNITAASSMHNDILSSLRQYISDIENTMSTDGLINMQFNGSYPYSINNIGFTDVPLYEMAGLGDIARQMVDTLTPAQLTSLYGGLAGNAMASAPEPVFTDAGAADIYSEGPISTGLSGDIFNDGTLADAIEGSSSGGGEEGSGNSGSGSSGASASGSLSPASFMWNGFANLPGSSISLIPAEAFSYSLGNLGGYTFDPDSMSYNYSLLSPDLMIGTAPWITGTGSTDLSRYVPSWLPQTGYRTDLVSGGLRDGDSWTDRYTGYVWDESSGGESIAMRSYVTLGLIDEYRLDSVTMNKVSEVSPTGDDRFWKITDASTGEVITEATTDNPEHELLIRNVQEGEYEIYSYEMCTYTSGTYAYFKKNQYLFDAATKNLLYYSESGTVQEVCLAQTYETGYVLRDEYVLHVNALGEVNNGGSSSGTERVQ